MRIALTLAGAVFLAGCSTPEPIVKTVTVEIPVAKACVPDNLGKPGAYADTDQALKAADPISALKLLIQGREQRAARLSQVEPVIEKCRK